MTTYAEKLKDPRWQKKRLEIFERDGWHCVRCDSGLITLHVHHKKYLMDTEPWDYPHDLLSTLCENCHNSEAKILTKVSNFLKNLGISFKIINTKLRDEHPDKYVILIDDLGE